RLDVLTDRLPPLGRRIAALVADAVVTQASLVLVSGGWTVLQRLGGRSPVMDFPEGWRFAPVVLGGVLGALLPLLRRLAAGERRMAAAVPLLGGALFLLSHEGAALLPPVAWPSLLAGGLALALLALGTPLPHALLAGLSLAVPFGAALPEAALVQTTVAGIGKLLLTAV
ncbi:TRAP transporter small permease subunit, partial [Mycobacterium tuberculosis]|nr:TRAP transporter small permease subunit [Mycobacterium tuberculosis]